MFIIIEHYWMMNVIIETNAIYNGIIIVGSYDKYGKLI